jgi:hypothetical protein
MKGALKKILAKIWPKNNWFRINRLVDQEAVRAVDGLFFNIDGAKRQVYEFAEPLSMATERFIAYMALNQEAVLRADLDFVNEMLGEALEQINAGKLAQAGYLVYTTLDALNNVSPFDHLLDVATVFFLVEGEDPSTYDHGLAAKKKEAMRAHQRSVFFCKHLASNLGRHGLNLPGDTPAALQEGDNKLAVARRVLGALKGSPTSSASTN